MWLNVIFCAVFVFIPGMSSTEEASRSFPAEWEPHTRTIMAWPKSKTIWSHGLLPGVRQDIAKLAKVIAKYEPVLLLTDPEQVDNAKSVLGDIAKIDIEILPLPLDDLWARDTVPVFVIDSEGATIGIDLNFNGWGGKQSHANDTKIGSALLEKLNLTRESAPFVSEGGALETDGNGTLLVTESSLVNENRNPGKTRDEIEKELKAILGVTKVIWFKGVKGGDITDAHVDAIVRFTAPGVVVLTRPFDPNPNDTWYKASEDARSVLGKETDAEGRSFKIVEIPEPDADKIQMPEGADPNDFLASYVNYLVVNGAVIVPEFGDAEADEYAQKKLKELYPGREIVAVNINNIAAGGGGIHCSTHDQPKV